MASLSTVYAITTVLASVAGMGAAFVGNRIFPLKGGSQPLPPTPAEVEEATRVAADKAQKLAAAEEVSEVIKTPPETPPELVQTPPETPPELVQTPPETPPELVQTPPETPEPLLEPVKFPPENPEDVPDNFLGPPPINPEDVQEVQSAKGRKKRSHK